MKVQILQEDLSKAISSAIRFINTRSTLPILNNFLIETDKSKLKIKATNLEMSISTSIGAKVEKEGSITIPAKIFLDLISNLEKGQLMLSQEKEELKIEGSNFKASVPTIPPNDFPSIPENLDPKNSFSLSKNNLLSTLTKILFSASLDETRPVLSGVLFIFKEDDLTLVSSDGFRLSKKTVKLEKKGEDKEIIIPRSSLIELIKLAKENDNLSFEYKKSDNQLIVKVGDICLSTRLIDGNFPNFEKIIPTSSTTTVSLDKNDFERGVHLASVFVRNEGNLIKLSVKENSVELVSQSAKDGFQKNEIEAKVEGAGVEISFNFKFVEEFLNVSEGDSVDVKLTDSTSPAIFVDPKDEKFLHLIMPVRVQS